MKALAFELVSLTGGQKWPVSLTPLSFVRLGLAQDEGEAPEAEIEEDGICSVMAKSEPFDLITVGRANVPIYRTMRQYKSGEAYPWYRVPLTSGSNPKMEPFSNDLEGARAFAKELAAKQNAAMAEEEKMPDEAVGLYGSFQRLMQQLGDLGRDAYLFLGDVLSAAKILKDGAKGLSGFGDNPPSFVALAENAVVEHGKTFVHKPTSVRDVVTSAVAALEGNKNLAESVVKGDRAAMRRWEKRWGSALLSDRSVGDFDIFLRQQPSYAEAKVCLRALRRMCVHARDKMEALAHGKTNAELASISKRNYPDPTQNDENIEYYTFDEVARIMMAALTTPEWANMVPVLALWFFGGIHFSEIRKMRWIDLNRRGRAATITKRISGPNHDPRPVLFSAAAWSWIQGPLERAYAEKREKELIFKYVPRRKVRKKSQLSYDIPKKHFDTVFAAILAKAKVQKKGNGLRHSFGTHLFHLIYDIRFVGLQMGSSKLQLFAHYIKIEFEELDEARRYFEIGHPDFGSFENQPDWIPKGHRHDYNFALQEIAMLPPDRPKKFYQKTK